MFRRTIMLTILLLLVWNAAYAQAVPTAITYQGKLTGASDTPVPDGDHVLILKLYTAATGGTAVWTSPNTTITTKGGIFTTAFMTTSTVFGSGDLWMETVVDGTALSPRSKLQSVPFAIRASTADVAKAVPGGTITASMLAADVVFMRAPYLTGVKSGLDGKWSIQVFIDGVAQEGSATLGAPYKEEYVTPSVPGSVSYLKCGSLILRRMVTGSRDWATWANAGDVHQVAISLQNAGEENVRWTFTGGMAAGYALKLTDDGLPMEELTLEFDSAPERQVLVVTRAAPVGSGTQTGLTSGLEAGSTYEVDVTGLDLRGTTIASDVQFAYGVTMSLIDGEPRKTLSGHAPKPFILRQNPVLGNVLHRWYTDILTGRGTPGNMSILLTSPGKSPRILLTLEDARPGGSYVLRLADDGLPVEDYKIDYDWVLVP